MVLPECTHRLQGAGRYWQQSLTIPLADDSYIPRSLVDVGNFNLDSLPQTQAAGIHHMQAAAIHRTIDRTDQLQTVSMLQDLGQTELR